MCRGEERERMKKYNEIRLADGVPDDIVIEDVTIHLEDMDGKVWWLGASRGNGKNCKRTSFWLRSKSKIHVEVQDNELKTKIIP